MALFDLSVPPLQGLCVCDRRGPRALPGAVEWQPFRLEALSQGPWGTVHGSLDAGVGTVGLSSHAVAGRGFGTGPRGASMALAGGDFAAAGRWGLRWG